MVDAGPIPEHVNPGRQKPTTNRTAAAWPPPHLSCYTHHHRLDSFQSQTLGHRREVWGLAQVSIRLFRTCFTVPKLVGDYVADVDSLLAQQRRAQRLFHQRPACGSSSPNICAGLGAYTAQTTMRIYTIAHLIAYVPHMARCHLGGQKPVDLRPSLLDKHRTLVPRALEPTSC